MVGIRQKEEQPNTARVIISAEATALVELLLIFSIAEIANGVAALEIPRIFALMHAVISSVAIFSLKDFGNMRFKIGRKSFDKRSIMPASFRMLIIPFQKAIIPINEMTRLTLFEAPEIKAVVILEILDVDIA